MARRARDDSRHRALIGAMLTAVVARAFAVVGLALAMNASCAVPSIVECSDGRVCPGGSVCTPGGCSLPGLCGDGVVEDSELCDDGNRMGADGCSPTCIIEGCPNGELDLGEQCDDGNAASHDGCSSGCRSERPTWYELIRDSPPGGLADMAVAWIPDRGRALLHGGSDGMVNRAEAWWWDGSTWTPAPSGPPAVREHAMASDGAGGVVMFGGVISAPTDQCWQFSTAWTPCAGPRPLARRAPALATGGIPGEVVMYGGYDAAVFDARTWRWSATGWSDTGRAGPSAQLPAMAYDPIANEHVLVHLGPLPPKTWTLRPAGWTSLVDGFVLLHYAPIVYDADRRVMVVFGGQDELVFQHNELLERSATGWRELAVGTRPLARWGHASFHDPIRHVVVVFGGYGGPTPFADTWIMRWESSTIDENCVVTTDADNDGFAGCADPDCWGRCDPRCAPGDPDCDPARPRCGDGICNNDLETSASCPSDCT